jgi:hypothetical protein
MSSSVKKETLLSLFERSRAQRHAPSPSIKPSSFHGSVLVSSADSLEAIGDDESKRLVELLLPSPMVDLATNSAVIPATTGRDN